MLNKIILTFIGLLFLFDAFGATPTSDASIPRGGNIDKLITDKAREYGFAPSLIHALVEVESTKKTDAVSHMGAMGLMQVMPKYHLRSCGLKAASELFTPFKNLDCGLSILRNNVDKFGLFNGLKAYNGGAGCLKKNCGKENLEYPHKILNKLA
jgi:soluble lytic murein transglycosylase-like protein